MTDEAPKKGKPWWVWLVSAPLACCLLGGACMGYKRVTLDSDPVYQGAMKRAAANGTVKSRLGAPLTVTGVSGMSFSFKKTELMLEISGPKGTGKLLASATGEEPDSLEIFKMKVRIEATGEIISLDGGKTSSADDF